jgi:predicted transporter
MELKSLILGLAFSVGIFAVKSGAGLSCLFTRKVTLSGRLAAFCGFIAGYGIVFFPAWFLASRTNLLSHLDTIMLFLKNGMALHFLLAALLLIWGLALLQKGRGAEPKSHGWLLLTLPCPVCFSVILFSGAFLHNLLPDVPYPFAWLFAGFITVSLMSGLALSFVQQGNPEHSLGTVMVLAALYFLLTIAVVPQFGEIERIYRLSRTSVTSLADSRMHLLLAGMSLAFTIGLLKTVWRLSWK